MDSVKTLNYAPKPSAAHRYLRRIYRVVLLATLIALIVFWGPGGWRRARQVYTEYRAASYLQPADHVAFDENSKGAAMADRPFNYPSGTFFLHERRRPDGTRRLVAMWAAGKNSPGSDSSINDTGWVWYEVHPLFESKTGSAMLQLVNNFDWGKKDSKFFAGQPDPNNPSHFTFVYETDGNKHTVDCWLNDNDRLIISQRP